EAVRHHNWYLARSVAQDESPSCVEQIRWNDQFPDDAHELAGVTFAAHVRRQHIMRPGHCAGTQAANFGEQQLLHAVMLREFSACLDGVAALETDTQQCGVSPEHVECASETAQRPPHGWNQLRHGTVPAFELSAPTGSQPS